MNQLTKKAVAFVVGVFLLGCIVGAASGTVSRSVFHAAHSDGLCNGFFVAIKDDVGLKLSDGPTQRSTRCTSSEQVGQLRS